MIHHTRPSQIIDEHTLKDAVDSLTASSVLMSRIVTAYGPPPAWRREPGFASLVYTILEQQVSLASARAVYERLLAICSDLTPVTFLNQTDQDLRAIGFSRQKTGYCRQLARMVDSGELDLESLIGAPDETVYGTLTAIKGIGPWTAHVYLLHSLGRPDIWPTGDLALRVALQEELELDRQPTQEEALRLGEEFRPLRSVAARVFWHGYLSRRGITEVT